MLTPLVVLAFQGREWWRHVSMILGLGYLVPVLGTLAGRRLTESARKRGRHIAFVARASVGMALMCVLSVLFLLLSSASLDVARARLYGLVRFEPFVGLIVIGVLYALPFVLGNHDKGGA
ncbi:MAG: hypothetical protein BIP78_0201 [Candidatus Bipolaricaulis sibiricus]|uniref:Uncharacterized protein n=1 Tax=Bipolaricaulis sibiricus TaxID=2501609 RepID=A0A410FRX4_BIPS1|nr:MAG: hypothetical protein BIP78_0201 [Candidatus Bipolaricaulis sibiricus]